MSNHVGSLGCAVGRFVIYCVRLYLVVMACAFGAAVLVALLSAIVGGSRS